MTRCHRLPVLLVVALLAAPIFAQSADVTYVDGRSKQRTDKGTVEGHTFKGLVFKRTPSAAPRTINEDELISVVYARRPDGFDEAVALHAKGEWRDAAPALLALVDDLKSRFDWARQECLFLAADARYRMGDYEGHAALAKQLKASVPETRYLPQLELLEAEEALAFGRFDEAATRFGAIAAQPYAPSFVARGAFGVVRARLEEGDVEKAEKALAQAKLAATGEAADLRMKVMEARIAFARKDLSAARAQAQNLLDLGGKEYAKADGSTRHLFVLAGGANLMGDILFEEGKFAAASLEFSKTFTLLRGEADLEAQTGWAMWQFARCCSRIANATEDEEQRRVYTLRHRQMRERVGERYPRTRGGQAALKQMGVGGQ